MRVTFHTDRIKSVLLFVHRLTATERASIETENTPDGGCDVQLTLVSTTMEDLKRFMAEAAPPDGAPMAASLARAEDFGRVREGVKHGTRVVDPNDGWR